MQISASHSKREGLFSKFDNFLPAVARIKPLFHLEELSNMLDDTHPLKAGFLSLTRLGRVHVDISCKMGCRTDSSSQPKPATACSFVQRLLEILESSR